jgi:hypothetical protein
MKKSYYIYILTIVFTIFYIQALTAQPKDVDNWKGAKWGMTESEILKALNGEAIKLRAKKVYPRGTAYATVGIREVIIDSNKFEVYFLMNNDSVLKQINLGMTSQHMDNSLEAFESLKKTLIKEYGEPLKEKSKGKGNSQVLGAIWVFPTTVIILYGIGSDLGRIEIMYIKNTGKTPKQYGFE